MEPSERECLFVFGGRGAKPSARSRGRTRKHVLSMAPIKRQRTSTLAPLAPGHATSDGRPLQPARAHSAPDTESGVVAEAQPDRAQSSQPGHTCSTYRRDMDDLNASLVDLPVELRALVLSHIEQVKTRQILGLSSTFEEAFSLPGALPRTFDFEGVAGDDIADHLVRVLDDDRVRSLQRERAVELIGVYKDRLCEYACGRNFEVLKWAHNELDLPWAPYPAGRVSDDFLVLRVLKRVWQGAVRAEHWRGVFMRNGRVVKLVLDGLSLTGAVPGEVGRLTALEELHLGGNQLTSVPAEIGQLTSLERLSLHGNRLMSVPAEIGQLTSLESLDLGGNQLTSVPAEIGQLTSLVRLFLQHNKLTSLPAEIGQLTSLRMFYLPDNQLTSVPAAIRDLRSAGCYVHMDVGVDLRDARRREMNSFHNNAS